MTDSPIAADRDGIRYLSGVIPAADGGRLVGLARVVSDGHTIAYLQDILVHPEEQRTGVGKALMAEAADAFSHVRQFVLITDDEERQQSFYRACGFSTAAENNIHAFVKSQ